MSEIDLVPAVYRRRRRFLRWLKAAVFCLLGGSALVSGASAMLRLQADRLDQDLRRLQLQKAISTQQRSDLEALNTRRGELNQQQELLSGLRSGTAAARMFVTVDGALSNAGVWFTDWNFRRAGTPSDADPETVNTGYFIVVTNDRPAKKEAWLIETQMKIDGEALDHAALSGFVSRLVSQAAIHSVRVVRTETVVVQQRPLVRFSLDVVVAPDGAGADS